MLIHFFNSKLFLIIYIVIFLLAISIIFMSDAVLKEAV